MKGRLVVLGAFLCVVGAGSGTALALHGGPELVTYGKGAFIGAGNEGVFEFSARMSEHEFTDPFGEPHGRMKLDIPAAEEPLGYTAEVTCLTVIGNRAVIGGRVTRASGSFANIRSVTFHVVDNTNAGGENIVPDTFLQLVSLEPAPQVCPPPVDGFPLTRGDIVVEQR